MNGNSILTMFVSTALVALVLPGPALAAELPYEVKGCSVGTVGIIGKAGGLTLGHTHSRGTSDSPQFGRMGYECLTVWNASKAGVEYASRCIFVDKAGNKVVGRSTGTSIGGNWKFLAGSGKYAGITGGGPSHVTGRYPKVKPNVSASCWTSKGTYSLANTLAKAGKKKLTGAEIKAAYSGAKMASTGPRGKFLTVWKADGTMTGMEKSGAWPDKGKWWVKGDKLCRKWTWWLQSKEECFGVSLDGAKIKFWRADGSDVYPKTSITMSK